MIENGAASVGEGSGFLSRMLYQGRDPKWNVCGNVACQRGRSSVVQITNKRDGSIRMLNCRTLWAEGGGNCFKHHA
jgi:hypothetical protein